MIPRFVRRAASQYGLLLGYARPYWRGWILIITVTLLTTAISLLQPWPLKIAIDNVLGHHQMTGAAGWIASWLPGTEHARGLLAWVVIGSLLIFAVSSTLEVLLTSTWQKTGQPMVYDLSTDLFATLQRRSLQFHARHPVGDSLARVLGDTWVVHTVVDTLLFAPVHSLLVIVGMAYVMFRIDAPLTLLALVAAPAMAVASVLIGRRVRAAAHVTRAIESRVQGHVQQTLSGISIVQAFGQESRERFRFHEYADAAVSASRRAAVIRSYSNLSSGLISTLGVGAIMFVGSQRVLSGQFTVGGLLLFLAYVRTLQTQVKTLVGIYPALQSAGARFDRVMEVLEAPTDVRDRPNAVPLQHVRGHIVFESVGFRYDDDRQILQDISLEVQPGQTVAIVGATGAGKTTLASLVPRFFDPTDGRVLVDGHDLRDVTLSSLRAHIAIVPQESLLFPVSISENIAYGRPQATAAEIEAAARAANAHAFIEGLPNGYATVVGTRGATLSGGERQRIAIARALVKDAPILLLDEPTSALDGETEQLLLAALHRLMAGRTTIVIAHRLSTIRSADVILVLDAGRIVEVGSHEALMSRRGRYASLHALQSGGRLAELEEGART